MRGPRPQPTVLKLLRGNPSRRPLNKAEPTPETPPAMPEPPSHLLPLARDEWWRCGGILHALGLLTVVDIMPFAAYCQSVARWQMAEQALAKLAERDPTTGALLIKSALGDPRVNPLLKIADRAAADMVRYAAEFGLSPAARARVASGMEWRQGPGKFDGLLA